jgi:hypothetical protein
MAWWPRRNNGYWNDPIFTATEYFLEKNRIQKTESRSQNSGVRIKKNLGRIAEFRRQETEFRRKGEKQNSEDRMQKQNSEVRIQESE